MSQLLWVSAVHRRGGRPAIRYGLYEFAAPIKRKPRRHQRGSRSDFGCAIPSSQEMLRLGSEPHFFRSLGDLHNRSRRLRMTDPVRSRGVNVKPPDDRDSIASQHCRGKLFGQCAREGHASGVRKKQAKFEIWHQRVWLLPDFENSSEVCSLPTRKAYRQRVKIPDTESPAVANGFGLACSGRSSAEPAPAWW
jgi:hypothetical protein